MRILYISNEYPPDTGFGGIATYTKNAAEGMAGLGHMVHVVCRSAPGEPSTQTANGITVHRIGAGTYPIPSRRAMYPLRFVSRALFPHALVRLAWAKEAFKTVETLISNGIRFDIVEFPECGAEGYYFAGRGQYKTVVRLHTPWEMVARLDKIREKPGDRLMLAHIERSTARRATAVTSPTRALASAIAKRWGVSTTSVFPNPIPVSSYVLTEGNAWIYTGRVERRKGVHVLLAAYANLCGSVDAPHLRIVGRPYGPWKKGADYGNYIEALIRKLGIGGRVQWIKGTDHESVKKLLARSSVAVFPSLWENLSYGCLEAMASGCAVVASRCGGFEEIISHGETGILFSPGSVEELTQVLYRLFKQDDIRRKIGLAGRAQVEAHCDTAIVAGRIESCYNCIIEGNPHD
jgi:glycogen synthase